MGHTLTGCDVSHPLPTSAGQHPPVGAPAHGRGISHGPAPLLRGRRERPVRVRRGPDCSSAHPGTGGDERNRLAVASTRQPLQRSHRVTHTAHSSTRAPHGQPQAARSLSRQGAGIPQISAGACLARAACGPPRPGDPDAQGDRARADRVEQLNPVGPALGAHRRQRTKFIPRWGHRSGVLHRPHPDSHYVAIEQMMNASSSVVHQGS